MISCTLLPRLIRIFHNNVSCGKLLPGSRCKVPGFRPSAACTIAEVASESESPGQKHTHPKPCLQDHHNRQNNAANRFPYLFSALFPSLT